MMKKTKYSFLAYIFLLLVNGVSADETRYYDIEVVIFESTDTTSRNSEVLKKNLNSEPPPLFVELGQPYPGPIPPEYDPKLTFKPLHSSTFQLTDDAKLLKESKNYNILLHTAWRQPGMSAKIAIPVHLHQEYVYRTTNTNQRTDPDMPAVNLPQPLVAEQTRGVLDGFVKIILSRYLHAEVDLSYTTGIKSQQQLISGEETVEPAQTEPRHYRLTESRKMRSKEVHYLDHPVLGMIILATPYTADLTQSVKKK